MKLLFALYISTISCFGQCSNCSDIDAPPDKRICWGDKKSQAEENYAHFVDAQTSKQYLTNKYEREEILKRIDWLIVNAPCLSLRMCKMYKEVVEGILNTETARKERQQLKKKLREIEDLKLKYFG